MLPGCPSSTVSIWTRRVLCWHQECHAGTEATTLAPLMVSSPSAERKAAFIPLLCYGCRLTFKELVRLLECSWVELLGDGGVLIPTTPFLQGPLALLPPYIRAEGQRRIHR